jgi:hypothetical protein
MRMEFMDLRMCTNRNSSWRRAGVEEFGIELSALLDVVQHPVLAHGDRPVVDAPHPFEVFFVACTQASRPASASRIRRTHRSSQIFVWSTWTMSSMDDFMAEAGKVMYLPLRCSIHIPLCLEELHGLPQRDPLIRKRLVISCSEGSFSPGLSLPSAMRSITCSATRVGIAGDFLMGEMNLFPVSMNGPAFFV